MIKIKRIYDSPATTDGYRVLVDRLWPRGIRKDKAQLDEWLKGIAPSPELRTWFGHKPERFDEFKVRYDEELNKNPSVGQLKEIIDSHKEVTLLFAAKDLKVNHAQVLLAYMERRVKG